MKNILLLALLLVTTLLPGCALASREIDGISLRGGLQAWVDAPLEGSVLTLPVDYSLVCHGSDPSGVQALEFNVNEQVFAVVSNPDPGETLFNASQSWQPVIAGLYTIRCRAQNSAGEWSTYASVQVSVVAEMGTLTPTLTFTPAETATSTATSTSTLTPTAAVLTFTSSVSTNVFEYQRDCIPSPGEVTITAKLSSTAGVKSLYLYFRLESSALSLVTAWSTGLLMTPGLGGYTSTISWGDIPQLPQISGSSAVFAYQFVVVDMSGSIVARSQVFKDITLNPCD